MKTEAFMLRFFACIIWATAGVMSGTIEGFLSSVASIMFLVAMIKEL